MLDECPPEELPQAPRRQLPQRDRPAPDDLPDPLHQGAEQRRARRPVRRLLRVRAPALPPGLLRTIREPRQHLRAHLATHPTPARSGAAMGGACVLGRGYVLFGQARDLVREVSRPASPREVITRGARVSRVLSLRRSRLGCPAIFAVHDGADAIALLRSASFGGAVR